MRYFNTSGPCNPEEHYTVMREALIARGHELVRRGRFFTIFAPRQAGKTTYYQLLFRVLEQENYTPIWITFESLKTATRAEFYEALDHRLQRELRVQQVTVDHTITNQIQLSVFLEKARDLLPPLVLVIDEFEGIPDVVLSEVMHAFREIYHKKHFYALHSLILVGVSTVAELVVSSASPFNVVDELRIDYFNFAEVEGLIQQYTAETGQPFMPGVIKAIAENTAGQPGLVNGLCQHLVEQVATDRSRPVNMTDFYQTLKYFLTQRFDKNVINVVRKARERYEFMLRVLFTDSPIPFTVNDPDIAYLYANGVIGDQDGWVDVLVPLYAKCLITAFRPLVNGETRYYVAVHDQFSSYATPIGINLHAILEKYRDYVRRRGYKAFDTAQLREGAWHYSLDGFINFFIERLGGQTLIEVPSGRGRTDILILYHGQKYVIETKIFTDSYAFEKGKYQLAEYLKSEGLAEGFYVVFSSVHTEADQLDWNEEINDKHIYTYIIRTNAERPTGRRLQQKHTPK